MKVFYGLINGLIYNHYASGWASVLIVPSFNITLGLGIKCYYVKYIEN